MCSSAVHRQFNTIVEPFPLSTFQFLRTCNRLILPTDVRQYYTVVQDNKPPEYSARLEEKESKTHLHRSPKKLEALPPLPDRPRLYPSSTTIPKDPSAVPILTSSAPSSCSPEAFEYASDFSAAPSHLPSLSYSNLFNRRQRGEKRPIPDEQKDEKYFERRKRNNEAAKKSRDARKLREDRVAFRAAILEHENAILRAQLVAVRDEMATLRQMIGPRAPQISLSM